VLWVGCRDLPLVWRNCRRTEKSSGEMALDAQRGITTVRPCVGFSKGGRWVRGSRAQLAKVGDSRVSLW
jgi:hypothetical protein